MFTFFNKRLYLSLLLGEAVDFPDSRRRSMVRDIPKCRSNSEKAVRAMTLQIAYALLFLFILCPVSECQGPLLVREGIPLGAVLNLAYIAACLFGISAAVAFRTSWLIFFLAIDIGLNISVLTLMVYDYKKHGTSETLVREGQARWTPLLQGVAGGALDCSGWRGVGAVGYYGFEGVSGLLWCMGSGKQRWTPVLREGQAGAVDSRDFNLEPSFHLFNA
ncbi:hypothetical protein CYMTET_25141 [Cymbomonas tetramitiformis]|uniref:Uncharacterized protein n=1 Tax=Cymbomonas tetramitiformis TaxID=36881 RepID=A0AAE0KZC6_9CHLO|nr:hypothetical protein CYMTET_25141 [Cymbomonas tetramitiformis]